MTPEGKIKEEVKKVLKAHGGWWWMPVPSGYGESTLDFLGARKSDGRLFAIETKAPKKLPTEQQVEALRAVMRGGGGVFIYNGDSYDLALLSNWLIGRDPRMETRMHGRAVHWLLPPKVLESE